MHLTEAKPILSGKSVYLFERLNKHHDRNTFDCGAAAQNAFLKDVAGQHAKPGKGFSYTIVAVSPDAPHITLGYYSYNPVSLQPITLKAVTGKSYPRTPVSCMLIGQLARDRHRSPKGFGQFLLLNALHLFLVLSEAVPFHAIVLDAQQPALLAYYQALDLGFRPLEGQRLFVPLQDVRSLLTT